MFAFRFPTSPPPVRRSDRTSARIPTRLRRRLLVAALLSGGLPFACSSISTSNYLKANWEHRSVSGCSYACVDPDPPTCSVPCARFSGRPGGEFRIYARGGSHTVARGPCLVPLIPDDPPLLEAESIYLTIRLDLRSLIDSKLRPARPAPHVQGSGITSPPPGADAPPAVRVFKSTFEARFSDGSQLLPGGASFYEVQANGIASFRAYASNSTDYGESLAERYMVSVHAQIELPYRRGYHEFKWMEIQPRVELVWPSGEGLRIEIPRVRMVPAREYDYTPFEIPLYFPAH